MSEMPERIFAWMYTGGFNRGEWLGQKSDTADIEYVRADRAALSSAAVAEREPVATVAEVFVDGKRLYNITYPADALDKLPKGAALYLDPPPTSELEAEIERLREALRSVETQADNAAWNIGKPGHKFTSADIQAGYFSIRDFARRVREGGKVDG